MDEVQEFSAAVTPAWDKLLLGKTQSVILPWHTTEHNCYLSVANWISIIQMSKNALEFNKSIGSAVSVMPTVWHNIWGTKKYLFALLHNYLY